MEVFKFSRLSFFGFFFFFAVVVKRWKNKNKEKTTHLAWNSTVSVNLAEEVASTAATASPTSSETSLGGTWGVVFELLRKEEEVEEVSERGKKN